MPVTLEEIRELRDQATSLYSEANRIRQKAVEAENELKEATKKYWKQQHGGEGNEYQE